MTCAREDVELMKEAIEEFKVLDEGPAPEPTPPHPTPPHQVRCSILSWVMDHRLVLDSEESFIKTKIAVVIVLLIKADYPERWSNAFAEVKDRG